MKSNLCKYSVRLLMLAMATLASLCFAAVGHGARNSATPRNTIVVGGDHNFPPYEFIDKNGSPAGYNVELTRAIAEVMGLQVEIRLGPWGEMRKALEDGEIDILQGVAFTEERTKIFDFSLPHAMLYQSIWTRRDDSRIRSLDAMRGKEVIVMRRSVMHDFVLENNLGGAVVQTDTLAEALTLLNSGQHDCALVAKLPGQYLARELGLDRIAPVARPVVVQMYGYAVKKGNSELLDRFNEGLANLKHSGRFQEIQHRWLGVLDQPRIDWGKIIRYGAMIFVPLLLILGGTVVWSRTLQRQVALRTEELAREVTEKHHALEELRLHQDRLVQADKMAALGILVSGVAHEINNPNGLILLNMPRFIEAFQSLQPMLESRFREQGDFMLGAFRYSRMRGELPQMLNETADAAKKIRRIVEDLKDFSRRDEAIHVTRFNLNVVLRAALRLVDSTVRVATDKLTVEYGTLPLVLGNAQRIEQVAVNLILNACQALSNRSQGIAIATDYLPELGVIRLIVRDEGRGIAPEHLSRLTDPFFTTKRDEGGTGLGLSVSAGIAKDHGGSLDFESTPGGGATVTLSLPVARDGEMDGGVEANA